MDMKIFNNMDTYFDVYACLAQKPRAKNELQDFLLNKGKPKSTVKTHVAKAEKGDLGFVTNNNGQLRFETEQFKETISQLCKEMGLIVIFDDKPKKKPTPEDAIAAVTVSHSPEYIKAKQMADQAAGAIKDLKNELSQKDKQIATLSAELEKRAIADTVSQMNQKKLVIGTAQFKPDGALEADFFTDAKKKLLDVSGLVSRNGNKDTDVSEGATELNEENYLKRIARTLFNGNLLRLIADGKNVKGEKSKPDSEKERLESINEILRMENVPNQVKLSLYALWFKGDSEMENLLNYAGEHCINADYVIRLFEKPREYQNGKMLRGMMKQAMKASEAHIKKEAALELIAGEWYVEAEYDGTMTRFVMVPESELLKIKNTSLQYHGEKLVETIDCLMLENKGLEADEQNKTERLCISKNVTGNDIEVPVFLHEKDGEVNCHAPVDEDAVYDDFEEGNADGEYV